MGDRYFQVKDYASMIYVDPSCIGEFGEANMLKFNNALLRIQDWNDIPSGVKVSFISSNKKAALYAVAYGQPGGECKTDAVRYMYKDRTWVMDSLRTGFERDFVTGYLRSVYGARSVSELDVVRELVLFEMSNAYSASFYGSLGVSCAAGGLVLLSISEDDFLLVHDFTPYEELDREKVGIFYGDVLRYYANGEDKTIIGQDADKQRDRVPKELLMELAGLRPVLDGNGEIADFERIDEYNSKKNRL